MFVVLTLPFAASVVKDVRLRLEGFARTALAFAVMIAVFGVVVFEKRSDFGDLWRSSMRTYCDRGMRCSEGLVEYPVQRPPVDRGFNFYDWGGYLIGRGVKTNVFIDGRMHLWERGDFRPMEIYRAIYLGHNLEAFDRFEFDWVIVPTYSGFGRELLTSLSPLTGHPEWDQWEIAYRDDAALYRCGKGAGPAREGGPRTIAAGPTSAARSPQGQKVDAATVLVSRSACSSLVRTPWTWPSPPVHLSRALSASQATSTSSSA